jgi:hypothetical protein
LAEQFAVDLDFGQLDERDGELLAVDVQVVALDDIAKAYEAVLDAFGGFAGRRRFLKLGGRDLLALD